MPVSATLGTLPVPAMLWLQDEFRNQEADGDRRQGGDHTGQHKTMVQDVFSNPGRTGLIERNCREERSIRGKEKVAVDGWEDGNQYGRTEPQRNPGRH